MTTELDYGCLGGVWGLYSKSITNSVGLYSINERETSILTLFKNVGLYYKLERCNSLIINLLYCILIPYSCINIRRETQKIITYDLTQ